LVSLLASRIFTAEFRILIKLPHKNYSKKRKEFILNEEYLCLVFVCDESSFFRHLQQNNQLFKFYLAMRKVVHWTNTVLDITHRTLSVLMKNRDLHKNAYKRPSRINLTKKNIASIKTLITCKNLDNYQYEPWPFEILSIYHGLAMTLKKNEKQKNGKFLKCSKKYFQTTTVHVVIHLNIKED